MIYLKQIVPVVFDWVQNVLVFFIIKFTLEHSQRETGFVISDCKKQLAQERPCLTLKYRRKLLFFHQLCARQPPFDAITGRSIFVVLL